MVSHVLQYINTDPKQFIKKIQQALTADGEAWIIQQTRQGMYQIIEHTREYLTDPRFKDWITFEDYVKIVDELGIPYQTHILPSSIDGIDFKNPGKEGQLRLEFMLCLQQGYDQSPQELRQSLAQLPNLERINHPNGILKIRR